MKLQVTEQGVLIPKEFLGESLEVELTQENGKIIITTIQPKPSIWQLGQNPIQCDVNDLAANHDHYII
jgi:virulence-associated protein VagC